MKAIIAALALVSVSSFASAQPTKAAIKSAVSQKLNGESMKGARVTIDRFNGPAGVATVSMKEFAGGPIFAGKSDMKMEPIATVNFNGNKITSVSPIERSPIVPLDKVAATPASVIDGK
jgi:hypothetical protein